MGRAAEGWRIVAGRRDDDPLYIRFRHAGQRYYLSTGERDSEPASKRAASIYAEVVSGRRRPGAALSSRTPIDELASNYLEHVESTGTPERFGMQCQHFRVHLLPFFRSLEEIGAEASWADFHAHRRRKGASTRTIAKELSTLRSFAKWCRQRGVLQAVPEYRGPRITSDFEALCLEPEQIEALLAALPETVSRGAAAGRPIRARYVFAWETALRPATIARIRVDDYDRSRKRLRIRDSVDKARFGRELALSERAWRALEAMSQPAGLIFGAARLGGALKAAAVASGLSNEVAKRMTPYTFRHSRITHLASVSTDIRAVAYLAGHKNLATTSHYVHGNVKAGERLLAAAVGDTGWQPPVTGNSGPETGVVWPSTPEENQQFSPTATDPGSCTRNGVEVRVLSFAPGCTQGVFGGSAGVLDKGPRVKTRRDVHGTLSGEGRA
jgi:integrase/recombinase XerC